MTAENQSLHAARQAQIAERDALRREHSEALLQVTRVGRARATALETISQAQGWISAATLPGNRLKVEALGIAQGVIGYTRGELAGLDRQLASVRAQAEQLRGEVAARQSKIRALDRVVSLRRLACRHDLQRRAERELDRDAAALAPALSALRSQCEYLGDASPSDTQQQECESWR